MNRLLAKLGEIGELRRMVAKKRETVRYYEAMSLAVPGLAYGEDVLHGERSTKAPFEKWVLKALDLEREIEGDEARLGAMMDEAVSMLEGVVDLRYRSVVLFRDVMGLAYPEVAERMSVARSTAYRLHSEAMERLEAGIL